MKKNVGLISKFTNIVSFVCLCKPLANTHYAQQMHNQTFQRSFFIWRTSCIKAVLTEAEQLASYSQSSGPHRPRVAQSVRTVYELPLQKNKAPRGCAFSLGQNYNKSSFDLIFSLAVRLNKWRPPRHTPHAPATANMWQELLWEGWMVKWWIISHPQHQRTISIWSVQSMNEAHRCFSIWLILLAFAKSGSIAEGGKGGATHAPNSPESTCAIKPSKGLPLSLNISKISI